MKNFANFSIFAHSLYRDVLRKNWPDLLVLVVTLSEFVLLPEFATVFSSENETQVLNLHT